MLAEETRNKVVAALDGVLEALNNFKAVTLEVLSMEQDPTKAETATAMYSDLSAVMAKMEVAFASICRKLMGA